MRGGRPAAQRGAAGEEAGRAGAAWAALPGRPSGARLLGPPALPMAFALGAAPLGATLQHLGLAPLALGCFLAAVLLHRGRLGAWPRPAATGPGGWALAALLLLALWGAASAAWAPDPGRAALEAARFGGFLLLGAAALAALSAEPAARRRAAGLALSGGLALGAAAAVLDLASGHALRAGVRGLSEAPETLGHGLKAAASVLALLLPAALSVPGLSRGARAGLGLLGGGAVLVLPGEAARLALLAGLAGLLLGRLSARAPSALGLALALALLAAPLLLGALLGSRLLPADRLPFSAVHRLLVWDHGLSAVPERLLLGHGMEASRALPGGREAPSAAAMDRVGLSPGSPLREALGPGGGAERMPLHPHNAFLQLWLELGAVGAALAAAGLAALGLAAARLPRRARGAATGMLAAGAVTGMLSFGAWQPWWLAALLLALVSMGCLTRGGPWEDDPTSSPETRPERDRPIRAGGPAGRLR